MKTAHLYSALISTALRRTVMRPLMLAGMAAGLVSSVTAVPITLSVPDFIIPVAGQSATLTVFSSGAPSIWSGSINPLGGQSLTLAANSSSSGSLTLNMVFSGDPLGNPAYSIDQALLKLKFFDLDFNVDNVATSITLTETAFITSLNGLSQSINLNSFRPPGPTDEVLVTLNPIPLIPLLPSSAFTNPFTVTLGMTATVTNNRTTAVSLVNTPEGLIADLSLDITSTRVPDSGSITLFLGMGLAVLPFLRRIAGRKQHD